VDGLPVLDLREPSVRDALAVDLDDLTGPRERAQAFAERVRDLGAEGMVVPSAAWPEHWNLVVFPGGFDRVRASRSRVLHPAPPSR
jgi:RES domain-containing protein